MANPIDIQEEFSATKKLLAWSERARKHGLDVLADLQPSIDTPTEMQRLVRYIKAGAPQLPASSVVSMLYAYDAVKIFGLGSSSENPMPNAKFGEIVIRYGGWSLRELRNYSCVRENNIMSIHDCSEYHWSDKKLRAGIYRLQVSALNTSRFDIEPAPVVLTATAMLAHRLQTGENLLEDNWVSCEERTPIENRIMLRWCGGQLRIFGYWGDCSHALTSLCSV